MRKVILLIIMLIVGFTHTSFGNDLYLLPGDTIIKIRGKVINSEDSSAVNATILYQKLPYYDDMGMASSKIADGSYEMYMLKNIKYTVQVKAAGFDTIEDEWIVLDNDNNGVLEKNFVISPNEENKKISLDDLRFASSKSTITKESYAELDGLVKWMKDRPRKIIQLEGHTDFAGNASANLRLSQERVEAVKEYLSRNGVKKSRVRTKAFGGTEPLSRERTDEAKANNRRVEVRILN